MRAPAHPPHFAIHDWGVIERIVARGDIGLGEDYIAGAWDTRDLETLIQFFLLNIDELEGFAHGSLLNRMAFALQNSVVRRNSLSGSKRNIEAHYDVGNDFYSSGSTETMTYSSALFDGTDASLPDAQRRQIRSHPVSPQPIVKGRSRRIGCGWGGFAEQAVCEGRKVTGLTISPAQYAFATNRLNSKADIRLQDYRRSEGKFDAIVSIEMIEAVGERYWPTYFNTIAQRLAKGGRAMVKPIVIRDELFAGYRQRGDFIRHYVFPGGMLPFRQRVSAARSGTGWAEEASMQHRFGQDYARKSTLRLWSERMSNREAEIRALGHDDRFLRNWQFYFGICAAAFAVGRTDVMQLEFAPG